MWSKLVEFTGARLLSKRTLQKMDTFLLVGEFFTSRKKIAVGLACLAASACATAPEATERFPATPFSDWSTASPDYTLYPGDAVELAVYTAPNLSRTLTVAPDGRIHPPLVAPIMAAGRTISDVEAEVTRALDAELRTPQLDLRPASFASQRVFIGGEVGSPGVFELPGDIGALEAVMMSGGWLDSADPGRVMVLRRGPDGATMVRQVDLLNGTADPETADNMRLQRFDVVFVPRSGIANLNLFVRQYLRESLPIDFGLYYDLSN